MDKLTTKQELFVQNLIAGQSQRQAYKNSFNTKKMTDKSIDEKASSLLKKVKIRSRYKELLKQFSNMALWSREQSFNEYEWLKNKSKEDININGVKQANSNAFLNALSGMNEMTFKNPYLADEKIEKEIEFLKKKLENLEENKEDKESKLDEYFEKLQEVLKNGD